MSKFKDTADAVVASINDLTTAAEAVLAAYQSGNPADLQAAMDELTTASQSAKDEAAKLTAAVAPPPAG